MSTDTDFQVGDVVYLEAARIRNQYAGYNSSMERYVGQEMTISSMSYDGKAVWFREDSGEFTWDVRLISKQPISKHHRVCKKIKEMEKRRLSLGYKSFQLVT